METSIISLSQFKNGMIGTIMDLKGGREFRRRAFSMGLNIGSKVKVRQALGCRGAMLLSVGGTCLAIGQGMAEKILLSV